RVVMRDEPERGAIRARLDRDDVRHVRGRSELAALRVDLLHAHVVAEETELVDDVLPGPGVLRRADGAAADGAGQHLHVSAGGFEGEVRRVTRAARTGEQESKKGYPSRPNHPAQGSLNFRFQVASAFRRKQNDLVLPPKGGSHTRKPHAEDQSRI